jgi:3-hydroxyisobutyrate dehydrogenase-like beta-hydroxyacid dehydrogenase
VKLSDDAAVQSTIEGILANVSSLDGKLLVDTTTIHPNTTAAISDLVTAASGTYLSSPVFGGTPVAVSGSLLFALAGPSSAIQRVAPLIEACLARLVIIAGPNPRDAMLLKATGNLITAGLAQLLSEAFVLAEKSGLETSIVEELVKQNYGAYAASVAEKLSTGVYAPAAGERPRSDVRLAVKDVQVGVDVAKAVGVDLEVGKLALQRLKDARDWGERNGRGLDSSSVYGVARNRAGLDFERKDVLEQRRLEESKPQLEN